LINFRFHVVSLIAVFLALGIGVIMGTAVIDRAVVDRLENQQDELNSRIDDVRSENNRLRGELKSERDAASELAEQGSDRLLDGALTGTPVLMVGARGAEADGLDDLVTLLGRAKADYKGTLWLTDRFTLDDDGELRDLAEALGFGPDATAGSLRSAALTRLARSLRPAIGDTATDTTAVAEEDVVPALSDKGFLDFEAPEGGDANTVPALPADTRLVVVSGPNASVPDHQLMLPFVRALLASRPDRGPVPVLAASGSPPAEPADDSFIGPIRDDDELAGKLSTVDDIDDFSGRLAAVLALGDVGEGRFGHFGRGEGAQRLLPAPAE
jgi:hypothetical protein